MSILNIDVWMIGKVLVMFALLLYIVFAYVIVRQTKIMTETLEIGLEKVVKVIAVVHLAFAVGTFFLALIIL